jgi:hypothetical protein
MPAKKFNQERIIFSDQIIQTKMVINKYKDGREYSYVNESPGIHFSKIPTYISQNTFHLEGENKIF